MSSHNAAGPGAGSTPPSATATEANHHGTTHLPAPAEEATAAVSTPCPACGKRAWHLAEFDLYYHQDGSENGPCWFVILAGSRTPPICPTCEREMHA